MTLQLKPPHLGRMKLNVEHTTGGIKVGIVVESTAARDMLLSNSHDLKTALADQGLRLDKIDVETQTDFGQSMAQAGRGFGQSGGRKGALGRQQGRQGSGDISGKPVDAEPGTGGGETRRLDLVA
jgi:flagellar hook-length control protein FliK